MTPTVRPGLTARARDALIALALTCGTAHAAPLDLSARVAVDVQRADATALRACVVNALSRIDGVKLVDADPEWTVAVAAPDRARSRSAVVAVVFERAFSATGILQSMVDEAHRDLVAQMTDGVFYVSRIHLVRVRAGSASAAGCRQVADLFDREELSKKRKLIDQIRSNLDSD